MLWKCDLYWANLMNVEKMKYRVKFIYIVENAWENLNFTILSFQEENEHETKILSSILEVDTIKNKWKTLWQIEDDLWSCLIEHLYNYKEEINWN